MTDSLDSHSATWINVDDPVMGGLSSSTTTRHEDEGRDPAVRFEGTVSLENNGGFCSTRTEGQTWEAPDATAFAFEATGDGKDYKFTVRTAQGRRGSYRVNFETEAGERGRHVFELNEFEMWDRGRHLPEAPPLDPAEIVSIGFLISDGQAGAFCLDIFSVDIVGRDSS